MKTKILFFTRCFNLLGPIVFPKRFGTGRPERTATMQHVTRFCRHFALTISFLIWVNLIVIAQTWTPKANVGGGKTRAAVGFSIGTKGYIGTGDRGNAFATKEFWEWDQATNVWTQKANVGDKYWLAVGFSIGTKGYIGAGDMGLMSGTQTLWEWDQATNIWSQKASFGVPKRERAVGFSIGNYGYIGTGTDRYVCPADSNIAYNDLWQWNQATNVWTQMANLPGNARYGASGFAIGNKGYIGTGTDVNNTLYTDFWEWDQTTNTWTQRAICGGPGRLSAVGFSIGNKGYIGTGVDKWGTNLNDVWQWDQASNTWNQMVNFAGPARAFAVGFSIGNKGYIGTGDIGKFCDDNNKVEVKDFWEFSDTTCTATVSSDPSTTVCIGDAVYMIASAGATAYSWSTGATTAGILVYPTVTTTYSVTVTDNQGCAVTVTITIPVDPNCNTTGVSQNYSAAKQATVLPNPFSESATVKVTGAAGSELHESDSYRMKIFDITGKEVRNVNFTGKEITLERGDLSDGVYFYKVIFKNKNIAEGKFMISKL